MRISFRKVSYASVLLCLLAATAGVTAFTTARRRQEPQPEPRKVHLPKRFLSEVKNLKVERHWVEKEGTPGASLVVVIRNKSDLAVTTLSMTIADLTISHHSGLGPDEREAVIEPYGTAQFSIPVSNFIDDTPFFISAAFYADGTEEGREQQLKWARESREERRAKGAEQKGGPER